MPRFPSIHPRFLIKVLSWDERFRSRDSLGQLLDALVGPLGRSLLGWRGPRGLLHEISAAQIPSLFQPENNRNTRDFLYGHPHFNVGLTWEDPDWVEATDSSVRLAVIVRIAEDDWEFARRLFLAACDLTGAFWGELNDTRVTERVTFSGLNQHMCCLPAFGTVNYLGEDYTAFLGREALAQAPFTKVETWRKGTLTHIDARSTADFKAQQTRICAQLGGEAVFDDWRLHRSPSFSSRENHVGRYRSALPSLEFTITAKGLRKRVVPASSQAKTDRINGSTKPRD